MRMQADGRLPEGARRGYANVLDAVVKIGRSEGAGALWSGVAPNVQRAMMVTVGHLAVYDEAKAQLLQAQLLGPTDGVAVHLTAALASALAARSPLPLCPRLSLPFCSPRPLLCRADEALGWGVKKSERERGESGRERKGGGVKC